MHKSQTFFCMCWPLAGFPEEKELVPQSKARLQPPSSENSLVNTRENEIEESRPGHLDTPAVETLGLFPSETKCVAECSSEIDEENFTYKRPSGADEILWKIETDSPLDCDKGLSSGSTSLPDSCLNKDTVDSKDEGSECSAQAALQNPQTEEENSSFKTILENKVYSVSQQSQDSPEHAGETKEDMLDKKNETLIQMSENRERENSLNGGKITLLLCSPIMFCEACFSACC